MRPRRDGNLMDRAAGKTLGVTVTFNAATLLGFLLASGVMDSVSEESWIAKIVGGVVAVLATLGYSASRAKVKATDTGTGQAETTNDGAA